MILCIAYALCKVDPRLSAAADEPHRGLIFRP